MNVRRFLDTNILLYAISENPRETRKREISRRLVIGENLGISTQVLGEFYVNATRKLQPVISHEEAIELMRKMDHFEVQQINKEIVWTALAIKEVFAISYWDAQIVAAAHTMGCGEILSEDLADGQNYAGVSVHNPFG
ncbi:MAG: PIN domain-containing protein [Oceanipulchritudo sp.]